MASFRDIRSAATVTSDDSSSDSDSDEDQPWKRRKTGSSQSQCVRRERSQPAGLTHEAPTVRQGTFRPEVASSANGSLVRKPKKNNIWGQVVMEQNEALVNREIDEFGMDLLRDRDVESYNYKLSHEEGATRMGLGAPSVSKEESTIEDRNLKRGFGETDDDGWLVNRGLDGSEDGPRRPVHERIGDRAVDVSQRKTVKARLGSRSESPNPSSMKFIDISPMLSLKEITGKLAYSLQEAKRELIVRVVDVLGVEKSLELWNLTKDIEKDGGMMIMNGSRRRLPGGVFLHMMKTDPKITKKQINEIFAEEKKKDSQEKHKRQKHRRKKSVRFMDPEEEGREGRMDQEEKRGELQDIDADRKESSFGTTKKEKEEVDGGGRAFQDSDQEPVSKEEAGGNRGAEMAHPEKDRGGDKDIEDGEIEDDDDDEECMKVEMTS